MAEVKPKANKPAKAVSVSVKKKAPAKRGNAGNSKKAAEGKKALFVEAYLSNGGNATEAALAAGYSQGGASKAGYRLSNNVQIMSMIGQRQGEVLKKYQLNTEDVFRSISQELHFNPKRLYNEDGSLKAITELDDDTAMALSGIEFEQHGSPEAPVFVRKVKWGARSSARDHLMKHLGMFKETDPTVAAAAAGAAAGAAVAKALDFEAIRARARKAASE